MKILFLDIDGVLNGHDWHEGAQSNVLRRGCINELSRVLKETDCSIVLSSAWRYVIHAKQMTTRGFEVMLRSHGASGVVKKIIGVTCKDEHCAHCSHKHRKNQRGRWNADGYFVCVKCDKPSTRGDQITRWLKDHAAPAGRRVALDDEDFGIVAAGHQLVKTNGATGMTEADADCVIAILNDAAEVEDDA